MDPKNFIRALQFALKDPDIRNDLSSIIDGIRRVGKKSVENSRSRGILIKFATYHSRSRVMKARSALKSVSRPLSSAIFLNEDPTRQRNNLVFQARRKKKANSLFDVWTLAEAEKLLRSFP
ncbi:hypothetical protein CAPTEDRAFT_200497 [Capitella teleta]|uniref:Uncharacterized protein n=1 Tax=Capitella teleta TaxID=283909 RepID=R7T9P4_CAPTE|nr:hypothetical protein CAPTEDRAFT_200497 [Capitella teleta]|eukprot:ELT87704.1 hypothetical protein CAPTEDRAFT_200497 [Capitella teleta]